MRSYPFVTRAAIASFLTVVAVVALASGVSASPEDHCNPGNVNSAFQAWAPGVKLYHRLGLDHGGLAEGVGFCEYRLYAEWYGIDEVCFCEDDFFFGGTNNYVPTGPPDGMSPEEAQEWLAQFVFEIEITPEGGEPLELDVVETAIKVGQHAWLGKVTWQQYAVFLQLPPGDYLSTYSDCHPDWGDCGPGGDGWLDSNVLVRVLPHEVAEELGPSTDPYRGSVKCPEE